MGKAQPHTLTFIVSLKKLIFYPCKLGLSSSTKSPVKGVGCASSCARRKHSFPTDWSELQLDLKKKKPRKVNGEETVYPETSYRAVAQNLHAFFLLELIVTLEAVNSKKKTNPQNNFLPLLFHFTGKKQAQKYRAPATKKGCLCCKIISTVSPPCWHCCLWVISTTAPSSPSKASKRLEET